MSFWQPHLIKSKDSADYHFATPLPATPGETLGKSVNLIVVATGKGEQLGNEFFQPSGALGKSDGSSGEQVGLGNQARTLVGVGLIVVMLMDCSRIAVVLPLGTFSMSVMGHEQTSRHVRVMSVP